MDDYVNFVSFGSKILIACPYCRKCAVVRTIEILHEVPLERIAKANCLHCEKQSTFPYFADPSEVLPFWLKTQYRHHLLWAHNENHLKWLEQFVDEMKCSSKRFNVTKRYRAMLPTWFIAAKGHNDTVKALGRLRRKLERASLH